MANGQLHGVLGQLRRLVSGGGDRRLPDQQLLERFVVQREEAAFEALLERHGPMVLRVCRRLLPDRHAAEDAFQATFLVLVRKAGSIARRELLANWLFGVAQRIAARAKVDAARRSAREALTARRAPPGPVAEIAGREVQAVLDEELARLPGCCRAPFLLYHVEGQTRAQVAQQLGWSLRTLDRRLERGRQLLRQRLTRRGVTLSAALASAGLLAEPAVGATLPPLLMVTARAATLFAAGAVPVTAGVSAPALALAERTLSTMALTRWMAGAALLLILGLLAAGASVLIRRMPPPDPLRSEKSNRSPQAAPVRAVAVADPDRLRPARPTDRQRIQGTWRLVKGEYDGQDTTQAQLLDQNRWVITRDTITIRLRNQDRGSWRYQLDPTQKPAALDLLITEGQSKGKTLLAIYALEGDRLQVCLANFPEQKRPTTFATRAGSRWGLYVYQREKAAPRQPKLRNRRGTNG